MTKYKKGGYCHVTICDAYIYGFYSTYIREERGYISLLEATTTIPKKKIYIKKKKQQSKGWGWDCMWVNIYNGFKRNNNKIKKKGKNKNGRFFRLLLILTLSDVYCYFKL